MPVLQASLSASQSLLTRLLWHCSRRITGFCSWERCSGITLVPLFGIRWKRNGAFTQQDAQNPHGLAAVQQTEPHGFLGIEGQQAVEAGGLACRVVLLAHVHRPVCLFEPFSAQGHQFPDVACTSRHIVIEHGAQSPAFYSGWRHQGSQLAPIEFQQLRSADLQRLGQCPEEGEVICFVAQASGEVQHQDIGGLLRGKRLVAQRSRGLATAPAGRKRFG